MSSFPCFILTTMIETGGSIHMSEQNCSHDCSSCGQSCDHRATTPTFDKPNAASNIHKVIGIVSGKGGVGKSLVTSMMAVMYRRKGYQTAILDADITGPSIPKVFGVHGLATASEAGLNPAVSSDGTKIMSVNLLLENEEVPVIWRGPILAGMVKQFWTDVVWGEVDYMFVDMPPGTGDVPLTIYQSIPLDGIIVVTSPQELVSMIVSKAVNMAKQMNIPILGLIENMSYLECPDCHKKISVFGESHIDTIAKQYQLPVLAKLPIDPNLAKACDDGKIEEFCADWFQGIELNEIK